MPPTILSGGLVVPLDGVTPPGRMDIVVEGTTIREVRPADREGAARSADDDRARRAEARARAARPDTPDADGIARIDCRDRILIPGLVNAHLHPDLHLLRGLVDDLSLHEWKTSERLMRSLAVLREGDLVDVQRAAVRAALAECALAGATTIGCYGVSPDIDRLASDALSEFGLHGWVTMRDATFEPVSARTHPHMYRLHAEEALTEEELAAAARAHERGEWIVMHVAETRTRVNLSLETFGATPIRLLARYGLLSPRVLLSHAVHVDDEEIELIARAGAPVISSPVAEAKLADGIAPIARMRAAGVRVALGTDAAVCNNGCDLLLEARFLGLLQRATGEASTLPSAELLRMATVDGAAALDSAAAAGIAAGAPADITLLDATAPHMLPLVHDERASNLLPAILFSATGRDVTDVMAEGEWVVRGGCLVHGDMTTILDDLGHAAGELLRRTSIR